MSLREFVALGTSSQVPTRYRNHNGYLLRWDGVSFLFDPGEGTQRQFIMADIAVPEVTRILITHFHGDHALGLAGIVQRLSLDRVPHAVEVFFPRSGQAYYERLIRSTIFHRTVELVPRPVKEPGVVVEDATFAIEAHPLEHSVDTFGYRVKERDGIRFDKEKLEARGVRGPLVGKLQRDGAVDTPGGRVTLDEVTEHKRGAAFGFVMDTRPCEGALALVRGTDLAVIESTYLEEHADLARDHKHLTAREAATIAAEGGVLGTLVLTHFSQRYPSTKPFVEEARAVFPRVRAVRDLDRVPLPRP
ncbi:MAG: ribonuclease Z [Planctomycetes bacterium]|nr:ribonuclease Z [Planctomycetota bacterium]MCW8139087.1 ribonuclease Z [Planctomycetota bacterium]